ncbi:MAG: HD domain-containing protein [Candidatus Puniceispirillales bacterium]
MKDETERRAVIDKIVEIFRENGAEEYLGEPVTMAEHMLQTAYFTAEAGGEEDAVVAALIHDIGHFTSKLGSFAMNDVMDRMHEDAGAMLLEGVFPQVVVDCVKHHVAAKRYLCAVDEAYHAGLSDASKHSLKLQGGPMDADERQAFEAIPGVDKILLVRRCDDQGKVPGMDVPPLEDYLPMLYRTAGLAA